MVKLADYLNYLNNEIIQARKNADEMAVRVAQEYAKDPYLKYFRVPRFSMHNIKMDVPLKVSDIDADSSYRFKMDSKTFIEESNKELGNISKNYKIKIIPINSKVLASEPFAVATNFLSEREYPNSNFIEEALDDVDFRVMTEFYLEISKVSSREITEEIFVKITNVFKDAYRNRFIATSVDLTNIFIDPDTTKDVDKDKMFINLQVELIEEGLRINKAVDKDGNEIEEIIFE
ncbi:MAG: hypothetical protein AAFO07_16585 [Bacteroidota bacterium]